MTKQKESSDQGIRKTEQDSAQPIKQQIRWIPNNSGPRGKKKATQSNLAKEWSHGRIPENDGPSSSSTKNSEVLNSTSEFHPSPLLPLKMDPATIAASSSEFLPEFSHPSPLLVLPLIR